MACNQSKKARSAQHRVIIAMLTVQALTLGVGGYLTLRHARSGVSERLGERAMEENKRLASNLLSTLEKQVGEALGREGEAWQAAQTIVERFDVPAGVTVMVLDEEGRVLCHPSLRTDPTVRTFEMGWQPIRLDDTGDVVEVSWMRNAEIRTASTRLLSGNSAVAIGYSPTLGAQIVLTQPTENLATASASVAEGSLVWASVAGVGLMGFSMLGTVILARKHDAQLRGANARLEAEVERRTRQGLANRDGLIFGLAKLADYRDTDTGSHLERICTYCVLLAEEALASNDAISRPWIRLLKTAASMHDIGKVGVPDQILLKPGPLTPDERRQMETHTIIGAETLVAISHVVGDDELISLAAEIALSHHERWDGFGYPHGLGGDRIPLSARIVALADVYDALTTRRVYKPALSHQQACEIIRASKGTHFDPALVEAFERVHEQFDAVRGRMLDEEGRRDKEAREAWHRAAGQPRAA